LPRFALAFGAAKDVPRTILIIFIVISLCYLIGDCIRPGKGQKIDIEVQASNSNGGPNFSLIFG
jgi:hypothetical protein